jgi:hypothetical protein
MHGGTVSPLPGGEGHNTELQKPVQGWSNSAVLWGKPGTALPWRNWEQADIDSLTKRKAHF